MSLTRSFTLLQTTIKHAESQLQEFSRQPGYAIAVLTVKVLKGSLLTLAI